MSLIAGATLQNQKYVIQKLLHQSDFGVTYQARHAYLEQDVVLQTLNLALRHRSDFQQIRQQFLNKVRSIAQETHSVRVLDCFEEGELPFVVFELAPGQAPPQLMDWFPLMPHTVNPFATVAHTVAHGEGPQNSAPVPSHGGPSHGGSSRVENVLATAETIPPAPGFATSSELKEPAPSVTGKTTVKTAVAHSPMQSTPPRSRSKGWMPIALVSLSMFGGLLGAGFGLSLRLANTSANQASGEITPKLPSYLFSREQPFPAEADWPVSETPQFFTTDPTPIEEPVYRINSGAEDFSSPNFPVLPEAPLPSPSFPAVDPSAIQTMPPPLDQPGLTPPPVVTERPNRLPAAPSIPTPAAPSIPAEPAPPALPEIPEPAAPDLPVPNAAPLSPSLPAVNSPGQPIN